MREHHTLQHRSRTAGRTWTPRAPRFATRFAARFSARYASLFIGSCLALALALAPLALPAQTVTFAGHELRTNINPLEPATGSIQLVGGALQMSNGEYASARSALSTSTFDLFGSSWNTAYTMHFSCDGVTGPEPGVDPWCPGDGIAFVITGGADTQVGAGGYALGYMPSSPGGAFEQSLAFGFQTFWKELYLGRDGGWEHTLTEPFGPNHADYTGSFTVALAYDAVTGKLLTSITNGITTVDQEFTDILLGSWAENARIGFTSANGAAAEFSTVTDWTFNHAKVVSVSEPATMFLLLVGAALLYRRSRRAASLQGTMSAMAMRR